MTALYTAEDLERMRLAYLAWFEAREAEEREVRNAIAECIRLAETRAQHWALIGAAR